MSSPARLGDNGLVLFWQEFYLVEEHYILEPLLWTFLLAADITVASLDVSPTLLVAVYLSRVWVIRDRNRALCNGLVLFMLYYLGTMDSYGAIHIDRFGVAEERLLLRGLLWLWFWFWFWFWYRSRAYILSIVSSLRHRKAAKEASDLLLTAIPAVIAVAEFYLANRRGYDWFCGHSSLKIDHEAVNRWKEDNVQILCLLLTTLLIALLIMRIPYARKLVHLCQLMLRWGCSKIPLGGRCFKMFQDCYYEYFQRAIHQWAPVQRILETQSNATLDFEVPTPESIYLDYIRNQRERTSSMRRL